MRKALNHISVIFVLRGHSLVRFAITAALVYNIGMHESSLQHDEVGFTMTLATALQRNTLKPNTLRLNIE